MNSSAFFNGPCSSGPGQVIGAIGLAHQLLAEHLRPGDTALDATIGNGHDTLLLSNLVGEAGCVIGCDIQAAAVAATRRRLESAAVLRRATLLQISHARLQDALDPARAKTLRAAIFNLGYLPGSDKTIITRPETTLAALHFLTDHSAPDLLLLVVAYAGHAGGTSERDAVLGWAAGLDPGSWSTGHWQALNRRQPAPELIVAQKGSQA